MSEGESERDDVREVSGVQVLEGLIGSLAFTLHEVGAMEGSEQKRDIVGLRL